MNRDVLVVSLGRIVADRVPVEATEAYAVLQQAWKLMRTSRDDDGAVLAVPPLDAIGLTAFGDFEVRKATRRGARSVRPPHVLSAELAALLQHLLGSGRADLSSAPRACVEAARRAARGTSPIARPIVTPDALFRALEAYRPRDSSAALAGLFARWRRLTDHDHAGMGVEVPPSPGPVKRMAVARQAAAPRVASAPRAPLTASGSTAGGGLRLRTAVAALLGVALLGGVEAWRWVAPDRAVVGVEAGREAESIAPLEPQLMADTASERVHTEVAVDPGVARTSARPVRPQVRRVLHAGATGRVPYSPSFDPHTNALVFHAGLDHTALLQASLRSDGSVVEVSTVREDGSRTYHAQVSPDGMWLAYDSDADGVRGVYVARRDGSAPRRVSGPGYGSVPRWSPDGASIAFARAEPRRPRVWNVWTVDVATGALQRRTNHRVGQPWGASWFPDGRRIAYSHEERLIVRDLESGASRVYRTPVSGQLVRTPAVAPDGDRIVFQVRHDGAWILDLRTGETQRLLADASAQEFAWSPDGRRVAYHSVRGGQWGIWLLDLEPATGP